MKKTLISLTIATSLFATASIDLALGGGRNYVDNSPLKNYNFLNVRAGKHLTQNTLLRLEYERSSTVLDNNPLQRALLNYEYDFHKFSLFTPYTFIGGGYQIVNGEYPNSLIADTGIGAKIKVKQHIDLFAELRGLRDFRNNDNHYGGLFGIEYKFGINSTKIKSNPAYKVEIQGYTDNLGNNRYNIILSQKRAKAIYTQLLKLGINKNRITWVGYGDKNPIATNTTKEGREKNRRVIAKLYFL